MRFIDSHIHLDFSEFDPDRDALVAEARAVGIEAFVVPGVTLKQSEQLADFAASTPGVMAAAGLHPYFMAEHGDGDLAVLSDWARENRETLVAIGECGLDRSIDKIERQTVLFEGQITLANELALPLIVHHRQSHDLISRSFKRCPPKFGGVIHAFSGSLQQADYYIGLGFKLGVGGVISFDRAQKTRQVMRVLPAESLLLETDAPSMPLSGHQGERNIPIRLLEVFDALLALRDEPADELSEILYHSCRAVFCR